MNAHLLTGPAGLEVRIYSYEYAWLSQNTQVGHQGQKRELRPTGFEGAGNGLDHVHIIRHVRHPAGLQGIQLRQLHSG